MIAWLNLRYTVTERRNAFAGGLARLGYRVEWRHTMDPGDKDIFVTWNRIGACDAVARVFESRNLPVLVTENAIFGNEFAGGRWYSLARHYHNTSGCYPIGDAGRWDRLGAELQHWRTGGETVILPQRGIGSSPTVMPRNWPAVAQKKHGGRIRAHPGKRPGIPLYDDLANCGHVVTWGSGAAIKALMMGIKVTSYMPNWIGEQDNTDDGRLAMFRRLAWAQFRLSELESGEAFARMLE